MQTWCMGSRSLLVLISSGCAVRTVCKLHDTEQARLGMDEAFCGGPCASDDAEDTAILNDNAGTKYHHVRRSGSGSQDMADALGLEGHLDTRSRHRVLCPDVFWSPSLGNISERISCRHLCRFIFVRACFRRRWDRRSTHKYTGVVDPGPLGWNTSWICTVRRPAFDRKHNILFTCTCSFLQFYVF
ncbi:hypothetical protein B0H14DRAFT_2872395 [Mycena olivaceomarginata]|nr:hypothetical protein B0H14DRAFT_2872395 [Mycena olivaceomarginata]